MENAFHMVGLNWKKYVKIDSRYFRPTEVNSLIGDAQKAKKKLGWKPKVKFQDIIQIILIDDIKAEGLDPAHFGLPRKHPLAFSFTPSYQKKL